MPESPGVSPLQEGQLLRHLLRNTIILGLTGLTPAAAFPCGNAVMLENDEASRLVAKAETDLQEGRYQKALKRLYHGDLEVESQALQRRIELVTSTALLRLGRFSDAAWAFDALHQREPKNTIVETRLGETLARLGTKVAREKALAILSSLESRDLVADEHGFLALAKLRDESGDVAGRDRALTRCKAMAKDAAICVLTKAAPKQEKPRPKSTKAWGGASS